MRTKKIFAFICVAILCFSLEGFALNGENQSSAEDPTNPEFPSPNALFSSGAIHGLGAAAGALINTENPSNFPGNVIHAYRASIGTTSCSGSFYNPSASTPGYTFTNNTAFYITSSGIYQIIKASGPSAPSGTYFVGIQLRSDTVPSHISSSWSGEGCTTGPSLSYLCLQVSCDGTSACAPNGGNTPGACAFTTS